MADLNDKSIIASLKRAAEMEGFTPGTEVFDKRVRQMQVVKCRELRACSACTDCPVFDFCELAKRVMREHRGYE